MKKNLFLSTAAFTLVGISMPVHAQTPYNKGGAGIMNDARRMSPEETEPMYTSPRYEPREEKVSHKKMEKPYKEGSIYDDFTGFYAGGDVGYAFENDTEGFNGGLFVGYGFEHSFKWLGAYAGLEVGYEWSDADGSVDGTSFEKDHAWLATFRPGVSINETALGYGIIGYSRTEFESGGADEDLDGLVLGAGAQFNTKTAFKPRLEYTYTNYEDEDIGGVNFDGQENLVKLGAVFQF